MFANGSVYPFLISIFLFIVVAIVIALSIRAKKRSTVFKKAPWPDPPDLKQTTRKYSGTVVNNTNPSRRVSHTRSRGARATEADDGIDAADLILAAEILGSITDEEPTSQFTGSGGGYGGGGASSVYERDTPDVTETVKTVSAGSMFSGGSYDGGSSYDSGGDSSSCSSCD